MKCNTQSSTRLHGGQPAYSLIHTVPVLNLVTVCVRRIKTTKFAVKVACALYESVGECALEDKHDKEAVCVCEASRELYVSS